MVGAQRLCQQPQPGQTLVIFALVSMVVMAGLGLVVDSGINYAQRRTMQNAADTAALRGARVIAQRARHTTTNANLLLEVQSAALTNGVPSVGSIQCDYVDNNRQPFPSGSSGCGNGPIPAGVTGVRVRVSEEHQPLVMKTIGITVTGTAAISIAQVHVVSALPPADVPFLVCGVGTKTSGGGNTDILVTQQVVDDPYVPTFKTIAVEPAQIQSGAYSYDWNVRDADGSFTLLSPSAPEFMIYGAGIGRCNVPDSGWYGLPYPNTNPSSRMVLSTNGVVVQYLKGKVGALDGVNNPWPAHSVNGTLGCLSGQTPTGCIMLLPIIDNAPSWYDASNFFLGGRLWGAFAVTPGPGVDEYSGRLVKNYPIHTDGRNVWYANYEGPVTITLVRSN